MQQVSKLATLLFLLPLMICAQPNAQHNLVFDSLAKHWDEAIPLGNGMLGALVWQKNDRLRVSLDRADLWDKRTAIDLSKFNFRFVQQQVAKNEYDTVHKLGDWPYDNIAYPTKLPGGALEFDIPKPGAVKNVSLDISNGLCVVNFANGIRFNSYIHATDNVGYFGFENMSDDKFIPALIVPDYNGTAINENDDSHAGEGLKVLGYAKGTV
ncbi:MAG TPA: glycoside hydrolase N-terminal domain-containing protein, partial [Panacibacter sp.]|nr:glycoside hydrolase N-terminal domain-containing protein [Panacibacter sp.]